MGQIFKRSSNYLAIGTIIGVVLSIGLLFAVGVGINRSDYMTRRNEFVEQPVQFSHKHHVGDAGIDCRYCHTSVERTASAGIPPTKTCMNCHAQLWSTSGYLEPVRASFKSGVPIKWNRVHDLPEHVYFDHSIHVNKGVGCSSCHGRVDMMPLMYQANTLQMEWCLSCHRAPEDHLRPKSEIYNMAWTPPANQKEVGEKLKKEYKIQGTWALTSCSTCHR